MLDSTDRAIVTLLQQDGRATNREIAAVAGVAPSTAIERVRSLHARGIITGYSAAVSLSAVGRPVQALIAVTIRPPSRANIETFRDWLPQLPETVGVFVTSGSQDFLLHIAVPDTDSLYAFVIDRLTERPEVADVNTSIVYAHISSATADADSAPRPGPGRPARPGPGRPARDAGGRPAS